MSQNKRRKLLLIGWDAADWKVINPLLDAGELPALESLINRGVIGNLSSLDPPYSPMLWTTIATGKRPDKHGILGFTEPIPNQVGIRPVTCTSRKVKAVWNILMQEGNNVNTVGWWPSHPAEPLNGICISDLYKDSNGLSPEKWEMVNDAVHPDEMADFFAELRIHPYELTEAHLLPFVPEAMRVNQEKDRRLFQIAANVAESSSLHAAATWILENKDWDFLALYQVAIDHICHLFMRLHPPKMKHIPQQQFDLYKDVVNGIYRYHDMMLGRLIELAGSEATIMLISDHGFHPDHLRPLMLPDEPASPAYQHRDLGIFCIAGPGIKKDERIYGASLLNITPTILSLYGLPVAEDMDGAPLSGIFETEPELKTIPSWETIEGNSGMHTGEKLMDTFQAQETIRQLVELGYIEEPDENLQKTVDQTIRESRINLARVYIGSGRHHLAIPILEEIYAIFNDEVRIAENLASCYRAVGEIDKSFDVIHKFRQNQESVSSIKCKQKELQKKIRFEKLTPEKKHKTFQKIKKLHTMAANLAKMDMLESDVLFKSGKFAESLSMLNRLEESLPNHQPLHIKKGNTYLKLNQPEKAIPVFQKVLDMNPDNHLALHGLAICELAAGNYTEAAELCLSCLGIVYHYPIGHFHLAIALEKIEEYEAAANACEVCLALAPGFGEARNVAIRIYTEHLQQPLLAEKHKQFFCSSVEKTDCESGSDFSFSTLEATKDARDTGEETIFIVSGLPRSGTSMMMQMLEAGGLDAYTDQVRIADENNVKGYFEHEAVKRLARDKNWLKYAKGKVVKVISHLLTFLPENHHYKIIFMLRDLDEVVASQQKMLSRLGKEKKSAYRLDLRMAFEKDLKAATTLIGKRYNMDVLFVQYRDIIQNPQSEAEKVNNFAGNMLVVENMVKEVNRNLYRERVGK
ncbi:MAG: alkaline phosphatase family protein [Bacteroidetes bacterium]|nr:alkaline phosphatase family protein [Bacteroidota bacterium]MBU1719731.1 alkaline phosphatase family protein [Bacteroidota bacterium]